VVDEGDHSEARLLDARTLAVVQRVEAPLGTVSLTSFSADGAWLGATLSSTDAPSDVFAIDTATGALRRLREDVRPGLAELPPLETRIESVRAFDGLRIPVLAHLSRGARASGKRLPVIVEFHGGPAASASVGWNTFARFFTSLGYAYVEPNVRGSTGYGRAFEMADNRDKRADWLRDVESVNTWVKAQPWADPARVVAMGGSYGGYSVLMALTRQPTLWRAGVEYAGIVNLVSLMRSTAGWLRAVWVDEFGDLDADRALLEELSPIREVDRVVAPLYVYAGQNDPRVPREEADQIVLALRRRHVPVEYQVAANEGHSLDHRENRAELMVRVARFLEDHLE
jgi:dipeptidyl aminopeptidase/acylaminoacyl peptidase